MDVSLAVLIGLAFAPLCIPIVLAIRLADRGPIIYCHRRLGLNGKAFDCYKFRTMVKDSESVLQSLLEANEELRAAWEHNRKLSDDPRIIAGIGSWLRKTSLDELPQLWNVFRGDMSLVGPRPVTEAELSKYGPDAVWYLSVRPGLTGMWQVSGRNDTSYASRVAFDTTYVRSWTIIGDLHILFQTIRVVLSGKGAY